MTNGFSESWCGLRLTSIILGERDDNRDQQGIHDRGQDRPEQESEDGIKKGHAALDRVALGAASVREASDPAETFTRPRPYLFRRAGFYW